MTGTTMSTNRISAWMLLVAALLVGAGSAVASAQWRQGYTDLAWDAGYRDGLRAGEDDARDGRAFEYQRSRDYRDADNGYNSRYGSKDQWKQRYREGFIGGYRDSYSTAGGRAVPRDNRYPGGQPPYGAGRPAPDSWPGTRPGNGPVWGGRGGPSWGGTRGATNYAYANGFQEGYEAGRKDGERNRSYDLWRDNDYRKATKGYDRDYGSREAYQQGFRGGFERGYDQGYRETSRGRQRSGWPRW
jgi:hypothetical protein